MGTSSAAHASAPVAVIRGSTDTEDQDGRRQIVGGLDDSRAGRRALHWALDEAERRKVTLTVVHAYTYPIEWTLTGMVSQEAVDRYQFGVHDEAERMVDRVLGDLNVPPAIDVERVVLAGRPAAALLRRAGTDRLLVVGTRGRDALGRAVLGSVSHQCLHHATGPVVVVP